MDNCSICLHELATSIKTSCNHEFHKECLQKIQKPVCPLCRKNITDFFTDNQIEHNSTDQQLQRKVAHAIIVINTVFNVLSLFWLKKDIPTPPQYIFIVCQYFLGISLYVAYTLYSNKNPQDGAIKNIINTILFFAYVSFTGYVYASHYLIL